MSLAQYGFQKLALLNSAGYSRAELPLDDSVSIIAPNNTGKTSLINALQFLLILDKRNMNFGAHDFDVSRRFYFPDNSSYILLEALLPVGMVVVGCVGKGLSHDYEYFAYPGSLDLDDYRLQEGSLVSQPQLIAHLLECGKSARIYQQSDLRALLYGNRQSQRGDAPDLTIFPLTYSSQASTYQRILTRTLRLDRLDTREVKNYLLEIFKNDLNDRSVDFKSEWDKSFADVNYDKSQYDAVSRNQALVEELASSQLAREVLRGRIILLRPVIEQGLTDWQAYYQQCLDDLEQDLQQHQQGLSGLAARQKDIYKDQGRLETGLGNLQALEKRCEELTVKYQFVTDAEQLSRQRQNLESKRDELVFQIKSAEQKQSPELIKKDIQKTERERDQLTQQLRSLDNNLYLQLQKSLPAEQFDLLTRLLAQSVLSLSVSRSGQADFHDEAEFCSFAASLSRYLTQQSLNLPGVTIDLTELTGNLQLKTAEELQQDIGRCKRTIEDLTIVLETSRLLAEKRQQAEKLKQEIALLDHDIKEFSELQALQKQAATRAQEINELKLSLAALQEEEASLSGDKQRMEQEVRQAEERKRQLNDQHKRINDARNQRQDQDAVFAYLEQLPFKPCMEAVELDMNTLADQIETYNRDCFKLRQLDEKISNGLTSLHQDGVVKFQYEDDPEKELAVLFAFNAQLPQEQEAIARKAKSAVVQVAAILRDLRSSLDTLKMRMNEFNNKINKQQLSDLKVFKIEPREEETLVQAIQTLIATSEQVDSGSSFDLFDHESVLDDKALNKAKDLLIRAGEAYGSIKIEHLFRLVFILAKENQAPAEFENIDSAASNGTVLMAKLITGLAMLNQMQDPRIPIKKLCYLDEAASLDQKNQRTLIETADKFGFTLIFASPEPQITARYCVPIGTHQGKNFISRINWQILEPLAD